MGLSGSQGSSFFGKSCEQRGEIPMRRRRRLLRAAPVFDQASRPPLAAGFCAKLSWTARVEAAPRTRTLGIFGQKYFQDLPNISKGQVGACPAWGWGPPPGEEAPLWEWQ